MGLMVLALALSESIGASAERSLRRKRIKSKCYYEGDFREAKSIYLVSGYCAGLCVSVSPSDTKVTLEHCRFNDITQLFDIVDVPGNIGHNIISFNDLCIIADDCTLSTVTVGNCADIRALWFMTNYGLENWGCWDSADVENPAAGKALASSNSCIEGDAVEFSGGSVSLLTHFYFLAQCSVDGASNFEG